MTHDAQVSREGAEGGVRAIAGLGNPGPEYLHTYHNVGMLSIPILASFLAPDVFPPGNAPSFSRYKDSFEYTKAGDLSFVKPLTFMNDSGRAVKEALRVLGASPSALAVAHDDSDLPLGAFKIVRGGGAAGHKGILSIIDHLGTDDFLRIRIGIRDPHEVHRKKAGDFVLSPIPPRDMETLEKVFVQIGEMLKEEEARRKE